MGLRQHAAKRVAGVAVAGTAVVVVLVAVVAGVPGHAPTAQTARTARSSRRGRPEATAESERLAASHEVDVFTTPAVASYLASRPGSTTAALYNLATGSSEVYNRSVSETTASIIKVDILATLLYQSQQHVTPLTNEQVQLATIMIEDSDDNAATDLWDDVGGGPGVAAFNKLVGMTGTDPNDSDLWGLSTTTAADQVKLLRQLVQGNLLSPEARKYVLSLMEDVEPSQAWGVSSGVPSGVTVAIKDGWDPLGTGTNWQINTEGWVDGDGRDYVLAVLTNDEPDEYDAVQTVQGLSSLVWGQLAPASQ
jgi:beta-lactamase class A